MKKQQASGTAQKTKGQTGKQFQFGFLVSDSMCCGWAQKTLRASWPMELLYWYVFEDRTSFIPCPVSLSIWN